MERLKRETFSKIHEKLTYIVDDASKVRTVMEDSDLDWTHFEITGSPYEINRRLLILAEDASRVPNLIQAAINMDGGGKELQLLLNEVMQELHCVNRIAVNNSLDPRKYGSLIGRDKEIKKIFDGFEAGHSLISIEGFPGAGKTSVALEIGYICVGRSFLSREYGLRFDFVVWISAKNKPDQKLWLNDVLNKVATDLGHTGIAQNLPDEHKSEQVRQLFFEKKILLIIDHFETIEDPALEQWLHSIPDPSKVIISSQKEFASQWKVIIRGFSADQAILFIRRIAEAEELEFIHSATHSDLIDLVKVTGGNPQALTMALAYIRQEAVTLRQAVQYLSAQNPTHSIKIVHTKLLNASWNAIGQKAQSLLLVIPFFSGSDSIEPAALQATSGLPKDDYEEAYKILLKWKLLEFDHQRNKFITHSIAREFAKIAMSKTPEFERQARQRWYGYYLELVKKNIIRKKPDIPYWNVLVSDKMEAIDPHWESIHEVIKWASKKDCKLLLEMVMLMVHYMDSRFLNLERIKFVKKAIEAANTHSYLYQQSLLRLDALGWTYVEENKLDEAFAEIEKGLNLAREIHKTSGGGNELIALALAWSARLRIEQKQVKKAFELIQQALTFNDDSKPWIRFRILMVAGDIELKQGNHKEALDYYQKAKEKLEKYGGEGHYYQINPRLGLAYLGLGFLNEAEQIFEEVRNNDKIAIGKHYGDYGIALIEFQKGNKEVANGLLKNVKEDLNRKTSSNLLLKMIEEFENTLKTFINLGNALPKKEKFHQTISGKQTGLYLLRNRQGNMYATVTNYGGRLINLLVPDENGVLTDVVVGPDSIDLFKLSTEPYFGATIGRYGNRIANGQFKIDNITYKTTKNEKGISTLHGGKKGFQDVVWDAKQINDSSLELKYYSKDGEEGFPGNLNVKVCYTVTDDNELKIDYVALSDKTTIINLTNHTFFNLNGQGSKTVLNHQLKINADHYTPVDSNLIPLGVIEPVYNTPFNFCEFTPIGKRIGDDHQQLKYGNGYDHNFVLNPYSQIESPSASLVGDLSNIRMDIVTKEPCILLYSGNFMEGRNILKHGDKDNFRTAVVLEAHRFPDSPNHENFPSSILEGGKLFSTTTSYKFTLKAT